VELIRDEEAGVFVATSPDLKGFVLEAATLDNLVAEMPAAVNSLMREYLHAPPANPPVAEFRMAMTSG
jgi:predicted RNase H-like HicB family nuclease